MSTDVLPLPPRPAAPTVTTADRATKPDTSRSADAFDRAVDRAATEVRNRNARQDGSTNRANDRMNGDSRRPNGNERADGPGRHEPLKGQRDRVEGEATDSADTTVAADAATPATDPQTDAAATTDTAVPAPVVPTPVLLASANAAAAVAALVAASDATLAGDTATTAAPVTDIAATAVDAAAATSAPTTTAATAETTTATQTDTAPTTPVADAATTPVEGSDTAPSTEAPATAPTTSTATTTETQAATTAAPATVVTTTTETDPAADTTAADTPTTAAPTDAATTTGAADATAAATTATTAPTNATTTAAPGTVIPVQTGLTNIATNPVLRNANAAPVAGAGEAGEVLRTAQIDQHGGLDGVNAPRIVGAARMLTHGPGAPSTMTVTLDPASLGRVRVELTSHEGQLAVRLHAELAQGVRAIGAGLDQLRNSLEAEGLRLADVGVGLAGSGGQRDLGGSGGDTGGGTFRSGDRVGAASIGGTEAPATTTGATARRTVTDDGQVDVDL